MPIFVIELILVGSNIHIPCPFSLFLVELSNMTNLISLFTVEFIVHVF